MWKAIFYGFSDINSWDRELAEIAYCFFDNFGVYPNVMGAGSATYNAIDKRANANPGNVRREEDGVSLEDAGDIDCPVRLSCFATADYQIEFSSGWKLKYCKIILLRDDEAEFEEGDEHDM